MVDLGTEAERRGGVVAARGVQGPSTGRSATYQGTGQLWKESKGVLVTLVSRGAITIHTQCGREVEHNHSSIVYATLFTRQILSNILFIESILQIEKKLVIL